MRCKNCRAAIKLTDAGWLHLIPMYPDDPTVCYFYPVYAAPEEA